MQLTQRKKWFRRLKFCLFGGFGLYVALCVCLAYAVVSRRNSTIPVCPSPLVVWRPIPTIPAWASSSVGKGTAKHVFIFSHGLKADRAFFALTALELVKRGYDVVLLPMPGHDENPDDKLGFGPKESQLIRKTIDAVKADHVVLVGCSMGGAATWLASDHPRVDGIVTECAFSHLDPATRNWFDLKFPGGSVIFRPVVWIASAMVGVNPGEVNPGDTAKKWDHRKPALIIQAGGDKLIPLTQGRELALDSGGEYWEIPSLKHAQCQDVGKEYIDRIEGVMKRVIHDN